MCNMRIRVEMTKNNLKQWQVANLIGISESAFSRKLRNELPEDEQERIVSIIKANREGE